MTSLQEQLKAALEECSRLRTENENLKKLLYSNYGIDTGPDQPTTLNNHSSPQEKIQLFKQLFRGRSDVFANRWDSSAGKSGYSPACGNEWVPNVCEKPSIKCADCTHSAFLPITDQVIFDHLSGKQTIGIYPLTKTETCWFLAVDFDKGSWQEDVKAFITSSEELKVPVSVERSRSGNGAHVWIFFSEAISAKLARKLGEVLLNTTLSKRHELGMESFDRLFPNQDTLPKGGFGNLIALPLQKQPRLSGNSVFINPNNFKEHPDQWHYLSSIQKLGYHDIKLIIDKSKEKEEMIPESPITVSATPESITVTLKNGIHIPIDNLPSNLIIELINLATFNNPEFYKAQAKRLSTFNIPRKIRCADQLSDHIILPRGLLDQVKALFKNHSMKIKVMEKYQTGTKIDVAFMGNLHASQSDAATKLLKEDCGILSATTGFGKTVVASALIAERKINTLIIVHRKQLMDQWYEQLHSFLNTEDITIGKVGNGKKQETGVIDIATIQTLNHKGKIKDLVKNYGQIIVDECHHISAVSFEKVLKSANPKYVCGLTATPTRKDGLHPIISMQCGPIRYKINAKDQSNIHQFKHTLVPRNTTFKGTEEGNTIQQLYKKMINDEKRNNMIFDDLLNALDQKRSPILLTERKEHLEYFKKRLEGFAKNIIVLQGGNKSKQVKELEKLKSIPHTEERVIIATGKYIGEGFDDARLDTLFLAMPISWKGVLHQYVGRLHRTYKNKTEVRVYDYVDKREPMLMKMYEKRLKGYKSLGYHLENTTSTKEEITEQIRLF